MGKRSRYGLDQYQNQDAVELLYSKTDRVVTILNKFNLNVFSDAFLERIEHFVDLLNKAICGGLAAILNLGFPRVVSEMVKSAVDGEMSGRCWTATQWEMVLINAENNLRHQLANLGSETGVVEEQTKEIEKEISDEIGKTLESNFSLPLVADVIAGVIIAAGFAAARIAGTILGGMMGGGPAGAVAAGLLLIIQQLLQGMNLEAFRGKTPEEMARMLPNYEQLVQATQVALEKGTDIQTELANLGATT